MIYITRCILELQVSDVEAVEKVRSVFNCKLDMIKLVLSAQQMEQ